MRFDYNWCLTTPSLNRSRLKWKNNNEFHSTFQFTNKIIYTKNTSSSEHWTYLWVNRPIDYFAMIMIWDSSNHSFVPANVWFDYRLHPIPLTVPYGPAHQAMILNDYLRLAILESAKSTVHAAMLSTNCFYRKRKFIHLIIIIDNFTVRYIWLQVRHAIPDLHIDLTNQIVIELISITVWFHLKHFYPISINNWIDSYPFD